MEFWGTLNNRTECEERHRPRELWLPKEHSPTIPWSGKMRETHRHSRDPRHKCPYFLVQTIPIAATFISKHSSQRRRSSFDSSWAVPVAIVLPRVKRENASQWQSVWPEIHRQRRPFCMLCAPVHRCTGKVVISVLAIYVAWLVQSACPVCNLISGI